MKAILYVGHGTRSKEGAAEAKNFLHEVMKDTGYPVQEISFLELTEPFIKEGFERCVARGATEITVVPLFLLAAGHIKKDIPEALAPLRQSYPHIVVKMADPFGVQDKILDAVYELVTASAGKLSGQETLLIVGRGSSDPSIHHAFSRISAGLRSRLGVEDIRLCYLAATTPTFQESIETVSQEINKRIVVVPYLLFGGLLLNEVDRAVKKRQKKGVNILHTGCLSRHRAIRDIVIERAKSEGRVYAVARH